MKQVFYLGMLFLATQTAMAQQYGTGTLWDAASYDSCPSEPFETTRRGMKWLPRQKTLKAYCPPPLSQGSLPTCAGFAIGYAACTIAEAISENYMNGDVNDIAISAAHTYEIATSEKTCTKRIHIEAALKQLTSKDLARYAPSYKLCLNGNSIKLPTKPIQILAFRSIFHSTTKPLQRLDSIKFQLADNRPVIVCIRVCEGFKNSPRDANSWKTNKDPESDTHALCIIGYDDDTQEFELMNSWGPNWANKGFIKIKYADLTHILLGGFCIKTNKDKSPFRKNDLGNIFESQIRLPFLTGKNMLLEAKKPMTNSTSKAFKSAQVFKSTDSFRIKVVKGDDTYLYLFTSDEQNQKIDDVFDTTGITSMSTLFNNIINIPNSKEKNYLIFLYSDVELDISALEKAVSQESGRIVPKIERFFTKHKYHFTPVDATVQEGIISFQTRHKAGNLILLSIELEH